MPPLFEPLTMRYAGVCCECQTALPARTKAYYSREAKQVKCAACQEQSTPQLVYGTAGGSAQAEFVRRHDRREQRVRDAHPVIGGALLALVDDPQSTKAWATGAKGERLLGDALNKRASASCRVLHDLSIPRSPANIDHIAVTPSGVYVIDAKNYQGRPDVKFSGPCLTGTKSLVVGGRRCQPLVEGMQNQLGIVGEVVPAGTPVVGVLCFIHADWPLLSTPLRVGGIWAVWPRKLYSWLDRTGALSPEQIGLIAAKLAQELPPR